MEGPEGNEQLTAMTGALLLALFAAEGLTILSIRQLLTVHFFLGMLLIGPVALKIASTCYRFARYYTGATPYVTKGPPALLLRLLGPLVIITSMAVIGTGVALAFTGQPGLWLLAHKASFVLWFGVMTIHVVAHALRLPRLLSHQFGGRTRTGSGGPPGALAAAHRFGGGRADHRGTHAAPLSPLGSQRDDGDPPCHPRVSTLTALTALTRLTSWPG